MYQAQFRSVVSIYAATNSSLEALCLLKNDDCRTRQESCFSMGSRRDELGR